MFWKRKELIINAHGLFGKSPLMYTRNAIADELERESKYGNRCWAVQTLRQKAMQDELKRELT